MNVINWLFNNYMLVADTTIRSRSSPIVLIYLSIIVSYSCLFYSLCKLKKQRKQRQINQRDYYIYKMPQKKHKLKKIFMKFECQFLQFLSSKQKTNQNDGRRQKKSYLFKEWGLINSIFIYLFYEQIDQKDFSDTSFIFKLIIQYINTFFYSLLQLKGNTMEYFVQDNQWEQFDLIQFELTDQKDPVHMSIKHAKISYAQRDYKQAIEHLTEGGNVQKRLKNLTSNKLENTTLFEDNTGIKNLQLKFWHLLAKLYYSLREYENSWKIYQRLMKRLPQNPSILKETSDSLRHQPAIDNKYKTMAVELCTHALEICSVKLDRAALFNSRGLMRLTLHQERQEYAKAFDDFNQANRLDKYNPIYCCNIGAAHQCLGDLKLAIQYYQKTKMLFDQAVQNHLITLSQNKKFQSILSNYINNLHKLNNLNIQDEQFKKRINQLGKQVTNFTESPQSPQQGLSDKTQMLFSSFKIYQKLRLPENKRLFQFYAGMIRVLEGNYKQAYIISNGGLIKYDTSNIIASVVEKIVIFLPIVGNALAKGVQFACKQINEAKIRKNATNLVNLATREAQYSRLIFELVLRFVDQNKELLQKQIKPDEDILPAWGKKFDEVASFLKKKKEEIYQKWYGSFYKTDMMRYGYKIGIDLMSSYVSTGKIYRQDKVECHILPSEMLRRLKQAANEILLKDMAEKEKKDTKANQKQLLQKEKQSTGCEIS